MRRRSLLIHKAWWKPLLYIGALLGLIWWGCTNPTKPVTEEPVGRSDGMDPTDALSIDAARLALRWVYATGSGDTNQVDIPGEYRWQFAFGLYAITADTLFPASDSVSTLYQIHTFPEPNLFDITVQVDSTAHWVRNWNKGCRLTGNPTVDSLMDWYALFVTNIHSSTKHWIVYLKSGRPVNTHALAQQFAEIPAVQWAEPGMAEGDGNDIQAWKVQDSLFYDYILKWGDCPAGCTERYTWHFKVILSGTGRVTYLGSDEHLPDGQTL